MEMHLSHQDKAIEFTGIYNELIRKIEHLEEIKIDVSDEKKRAMAVKANCKRQAKQSKKVSDAETIYSQGINVLNEIAGELEKHEVYYKINTEVEDLIADLNSETIGQEKLALFAKAVIELLRKINASDTRMYESEQKIVESVYALAYRIIKLEVLKLGKSSVLEWVRADKISMTTMNNIIADNVGLLEKYESVTEDFRNKVAEIESPGLDCSYLDEGLILVLALYDDDNISLVEQELLDIMNKITNSNQAKDEAKKNINGIKSAIDEIIADLKRKNVFKELGALTGAVIAFITIAGNRYNFVSGIGHKEYRVYPDFYSNSSNAVAPTYPEYMNAIKGWEKTTLVGYGPWQRENVMYGDYHRDIVTYSISPGTLDNLSDYTSLDFANMPSDTVTETKEELSADDMYFQTIVEITRLVQDENDSNFVPNEEVQEDVANIILAITILLTGVVSIASIVSIISKIIGTAKISSKKSEQNKKLNEANAAFARLCKENEAFRKSFILVYEKYGNYIKNNQINEMYKSLKRDLK